MTIPHAGAFTTLAGVIILLLVAYEVYATILDTRARAGWISESLNRGVWLAARVIAFRFLSRAGRHRLLKTIGPLLLPALVAMLVLLLMLGYALIYWPHMPASFNVDDKARSPAWIEAIYFSGITLTTLGYGDIAPRTTAMRLVALSEATVGFVSISLAVTYLLTVTGALERKRTVALSFYHQAEAGADAAGFITHHFVNGRFYSLETVFANAARDLQGLLESHSEHPIIHYFHPVEVHKSLPRMLFLVFENCAVIQCCLEASTYPDVCNHPEVRTLAETGRHVLRQLVISRGLEQREEQPEETPDAEPARWRRRYEQTRARLAASGIETRRDVEAGRREYYANRLEWERRLGAFAAYLGYDWEEISGDRDLRDAEEEEETSPAANDERTAK